MPPKKKTPPTATQPDTRLARGRVRDEARFTAAPLLADLPASYAATLTEIKQRVQQSRLRTVLAANAAMVAAYWEIGQVILTRQQSEGWGAKVIDRLSADLRAAFPDMQGLSPRNLKYMRSFAAAWPDPEIVQRVIAQLPWRQNIALLDKLGDATTRLWYAQQGPPRRPARHRFAAVQGPEQTRGGICAARHGQPHWRCRMADATHRNLAART